MSYRRAPKDHQSTAFPCPLRVKISGALELIQFWFYNNNDDESLRNCYTTMNKSVGSKTMNENVGIDHQQLTKATLITTRTTTQTYIYSIVPQNVWVTIPSWMCSLQRPKSVSFT